MEFVRSASRDEANLHRPLGSGIGRQSGRRDRHLLNRIEPRRNRGEEARAATLEPLRVVVDAIYHDVDRRPRHPIVSAEATSPSHRLSPRHQKREVQDVAPTERQLLDRLVPNRIGDRVRSDLQSRRRPLDLNRLDDLPDLQVNDHIRRPRRFHDHSTENGRLEAGHRHRHFVGPKREIREEKCPDFVGDRLPKGSRELISELDLRPRHDSSRRVEDRPGDGSRRLPLPEDDAPDQK
ncbi:hypothetical protein HRbin10_02212 [bacterium HR10]|nr:hypothetical protein HRbin10_02212 [bacterium HR10]